MSRLLLLASLIFPLSLHADVLQIPIGQQSSIDEHSLPTRGQRQGVVLERFGLPDQEHPAVGQPPITRWDYRDFSVYFESGVVINSVVHHRPRAAETIIVEEQE
ncbi:phosphodiesterase [Pseudomonas mangrovi]|jgi:hypothetical protein|uniref:Phosphodiesterase n=1 Tax=Pseudomonas mangrovi TaxID=2161748 RepID=A0A2T5P647_9PSED|nr:phosphodiesterase [Pseudomonas mangrovi]PTU73218.1 phosphodiesterase [Pseudomonas mangrovi]